LLDEDGRVKRSNRPHGNAFKSIRIVRGSEDLGSLFDVRMSAFDKLQGLVNDTTREVRTDMLVAQECPDHPQLQAQSGLTT
jgi:hypothetical protein